MEYNEERFSGILREDALDVFRKVFLGDFVALPKTVFLEKSHYQYVIGGLDAHIAMFWNPTTICEMPMFLYDSMTSLLDLVTLCVPC
jgi:hypothetical protein